MSDDKFLDQLRTDARQLQYEMDAVAQTRLRARVRSRLSDQSAIHFIAAWMRPLVASLGALALVASIGLAIFERDQTVSISEPVEVSMGGVTYSVGQ